MTDDRQQVVIVVSSQGLGGVTPYGRAIRDTGRIPLLITGPAPQSKIEAWRSIYDEIEFVALETLYQPEKLVATAIQCARERPIAGLFSCFDAILLYVSRAVALLDRPHPSLPGLETARNKYATRLALAQQGIPTPGFYLMRSENEADRVEESVGFPAIIKPVNGMASHLVRKVEDKAALRTAYRELVQRIDRGFSGNYDQPIQVTGPQGEIMTLSPRTNFLVEQYMKGTEYSAEFIIRDGQYHRIALFHKFLVEEKGFLECGFTTPPIGLSTQREEEIWRYVECCLTATHITHASAHVEIIDTDRGPMLVEINAGRAAGQILVQAVQQARGIDLTNEILALQTGQPRPVPTPPTLNGQVTTLTVFPPASGRLVQIDGLEEVTVLPGVKEVICSCKPGDLIDVQDKEFFAVNILVHEIDDPAELATIHKKAKRLVRFIMESEDVF